MTTISMPSSLALVPSLEMAWQDVDSSFAAMALRWTAAGMMEAAKGFRRLKAYKQLPILRAALVAHAAKQRAIKNIEPQANAA
jgi:hypothetical protein